MCRSVLTSPIGYCFNELMLLTKSANSMTEISSPSLVATSTFCVMPQNRPARTRGRQMCTHVSSATRNPEYLHHTTRTYVFLHSSERDLPFSTTPGILLMAFSNAAGSSTPLGNLEATKRDAIPGRDNFHKLHPVI